MIDDLALAQSQAEEDLKNHQSLTQEFAQVRNTASRVYAFLASHQEDRLAANQHYQAAADALERVGMEIAEPRGRSAALLEQVRGAAADLKISEDLAREDIRLAAQAQTEITEAGRAIHQARSYSSAGFGVDTKTARVAGAPVRAALAIAELRAVDPARRRGHANGKAALLQRHATGPVAANDPGGRAKTPRDADGCPVLERRELWRRRGHSGGGHDPR